jgi:hypothetical protein
MAFSIEELLGYTSITAAVEKVVMGVPKPLPAPFYARSGGEGNRVVGNKAINIGYRGTRKAARVLPYGAPPRQVPQIPREEEQTVLLHSHEALPFRQELLMALREPESYAAQRMAATEIAFQTKNAAERLENLDTTARHLSLANGKLWFDVEGNLLPTSSGADLTIDFHIPTDNTGQVTPFGGSPIIDVGWSDANAEIVRHITSIIAYLVQKCGRKPELALYGKNIPSYLAGNTKAKEFLKFNGAWNNGYVANGQIPDCFDLTWIPMQYAFFDDQNGTTRPIWGDDQIVFCPKPAEDWWATLEGSYPVLKNLQIVQSVQDMVNALELVYGRFGYAYGQVPNSIYGAYGDTWLTKIKVPEAVAIVDVTP